MPGGAELPHGVLGKPCTRFSASCTLSTLNWPRGLLGFLTLVPEFTGEEMQVLEEEERAAPGPQWSVVVEPGLRTRTLACSPCRQSELALSPGTYPSLKKLCQ